MFVAGAAQAAEPMSGAEFDAYTRGKTLTFLEGGQSYGAEEYRPGRQVKWAFKDGECQDGKWWEPEPGLICFVYDNAPTDSQCWNFYRTETGLMARFANELGGTNLYEAEQSRQPLLCLGPEVGV